MKNLKEYTKPFFVNIFKYVAIIILSLFLISGSFNIMPDFIKDRLPFVGRQDFIALEHKNKEILKSLEINNKKMDSLDVKIHKRDSIIDVLSKKEDNIKNKININSEVIKRSNINQLDSLLEDCKCL